mmetsp:Transcript_9388/g.31145  ORF Transcript_9388/g.31145 Transcript_9388/m.31145 type:complete len:144 (-) Transcript_9388:100-531(-)
MCLAAFAVWSWLPVFVSVRNRLSIGALTSSGAFSKPRREDFPRVLLYSESGCTGEQLTFELEGDVCERNYPFGSSAKDNVASVLLPASSHRLHVWGTCRLAERPPNPMLLETIDAPCCTDLRYPLLGSVQLVPRDAVGRAGDV